MNSVARKSLELGYGLLVRLESLFDYSFLADDVPPSTITSHEKWHDYLYQLCNKPGSRVLEVGSREVAGKSVARARFGEAEYVGFDYYEGGNVDVVGDAHRLSSYFGKDDRFDLIYSCATFEHLAMPWVVAEEMAKLLKVGGTVFVETHFSYGSHERPWNFFQFSDMALRVLFSESLGFECIEAGMSNPIVGRFSRLADDYLRFKRVPKLYCHSAYLGKKVRDVSDFEWESIDLQGVVGETKYPRPTNAQ